MSKPKLYLVDDGAYTWVIANAKNRVLKIYCDNMDMTSMDVEGAIVSRVLQPEGERTSLRDENGKRISSMWEEFLREPRERVVACSEW